MKRRMKKLMSLLISVSMVFSVFTMSVYATPADGTESEQTVESETAETEDNTTDASEAAQPEETQPETAQPEETQPQTTTVEESFTTYTVNANDIDVSGVSASNVVPEDGSEVDESSPTITTVEEELNNIKVLNEDAEGNETKEALTDEQIQNILYMYQQYLDQWEENANLLGVQTPFFLSYNEDGEDGLGILGEMLVLAGHTVDEVRSGDYSYDDLMGMIQNFYYADQYGIKFYGEAIAKKRNEVLKKVENSNAETFVQKLLVINDWLAHNTTFDMAYIMNMGREEPLMQAENPQKHEHYDEIYDAMYDLYYDQIKQQFHDQIFAGIEADLRQQYYEKYIWNIIYNQTLSQLGTDAENASDDQKQQASDAADKYMDDNADAISADAVGFVETNFSADVAKQMVSDADAFIKDAEDNGVEVGTDENGNPIIMTVKQITQNTMANEKIVDLDGDGENDTTANDAIRIYADQAAAGLTDGILGAWEGNHIGILAEGTGVCAGYSKAFAYLVQYMCPEQYGVNGAKTDMSVSGNWKTSDELYYNDAREIDINQDYVVDLVRITFDADVTMFGEDSNFGETHFWNAVKVDGEWYYVDPCYTDIYVECMSRDRVEIDGTMNYMYFMFSHSSAKEMYDGNMKEIATLYDGEGVSDDTSYEESWFARIASNTYISDGKAYYMYDSSDQLSMMREYRDLQGSTSSSDFDASDFEALMEGADPTYKLVYHDISGDDIVEGGADSDYTTLIEFNHEEEEESSDAEETADTEEGEETTDTEEEGSVALVYNPGTNEMEENELLTELFAQYKDECDIYPSIKMTTALYDGKLYFNLSNCILSYDLESGAVEKVREYNTVYGKRDDTVAFGGMGFSVVDSAEEEALSVTNHPIAALTIKDDGQMYVSIATNYAFISGKSSVDDSSSYGYEFEESNYNPDYSTYMTGDSTQMEQAGYSEETNDNDEFMWSAVFVDTMDMTSTCSHTYESVTVEPTCGRDGFTENRCTKCGAAEADSRVVDEGSALDAHHYVHFGETYYTKADNGERNTGECYVCTVCGFAIEEPDEPRDDAEEEEIEEYEKEKAIWDNAVETAGHSYEPTDATWSEDSTSVTFSKLECSSVCPDRKAYLDCLLSDETISVECKETTAEAKVTGYEGECTTGTKVVYTATGETEDGYGYTVSHKVDQPAGEHSYEGTFHWTEIKDDEGNVTGYEDTVTADLECAVCGDEQKDVEAEVTYDDENSYAPKCEEEGKDVYVAVATAKDENGKVIGSATDTKEVTIAATGHDYGEWTTTKEPTYKNEGKKERTCSVCGDVDEEAIPVLEAKSIILSEEQLALEIGESATLTATCDPEAVDSTEIEWKSSDEKVATVKAGKVTGKKEGTATITASVGGKKATCKVSVTKAGVEYRTHVQTYGWQNWVSNGEMSGTTGESKRLEGIEIRLSDSKYEGSIQYRTHVQTYGWEKEWTADGEMSGTSGQAKRLEAIQIKLTGEIAEMYDVYYRVHAQTYGWLGWAKNGECAGTAGLSKRLEGIEIVLVKKGEDAPGSTEDEYITASGESNENLIRYQTHVQTYGWQDWKYDGVMSGTTGQSKRLESIKIQLVDPKYEGSIQYKTHVQTYGWQDWVEEGDASGTTGEAKRLEAIQIKLTGEMADKYDIYYRVHAQTFGWLGWAKNGAKAGTAGYSKRLEGIEIVLVEKGGKAPGSTSGAYKEK